MKTKTYAEILARQGEVGEALAIYRALLAASPDDPSLAARIRALEAQQEPEPATPNPSSAGGQAAAPRKRALETLLQRVIARRRP